MTQRIFIVFALLLALPAFARLEYDSAQLMMKNSEQVGELVGAKIQKAIKIQASQDDEESADGLVVEPGAVTMLKDALRITFSRPDRDGTRAKLFAKLRRELSDLNSHDPTMESLADEALAALRRESTPTKDQGTYIILLENMMAEIKPDVNSNATYKRIVEKIRDANIKVTNKVRTRELLRTMSKPVSPSETAAQILPKAKKK